MGGQEELERNIKNYFVGQTFTTQDVEKQGIGVGNYDFVFKIVDMSFEQTNNMGNGESELYVSFDIIEGNVIIATGEEYDLTDHDSISDDLWWEIEMEIKDMFVNDVKGEKATKGDSCTIPLEFRIRPSDKLYKIVENKVEA